jgi:hypothetical protein
MAVMSMNRPSRTEVLRRQGLVESGFAVLTAVMLLAGTGASLASTLLVGLLAIWMARRGHRMIEGSVPLAEPERRELDRLRADSRHVRELLELLERAGQQPVRFDLQRCRRLARVESLLNGQS